MTGLLASLEIRPSLLHDGLAGPVSEAGVVTALSAGTALKVALADIGRPAESAVLRAHISGGWAPSGTA